MTRIQCDFLTDQSCFHKPFAFVSKMLSQPQPDIIKWLCYLRIKCDGQHKLEELSRRFGVLEEDLRRSSERADNADQKVIGHGRRDYTDKNENQSFLIYKEIHNGVVAKSCMTKGPHIWENICEFPHILGNPSSYMTLQLLHSKFLIYEENFLISFISV